MRNGRSFLTCPHKNVQQYTECCLDCGYNIYTTPKEYMKDLRKMVGEQDAEIEQLEKQIRKLTKKRK